MRNEIYKGRLIKVFTLMFLFLSFLFSTSFAEMGEGITAVEPYEDANGVAYLAFELPSTSSSADYRHQTYGWNINIHFSDDDTWYKSGYLDADDSLMQSTGGSSVSLKLEDVLRSVGVPESEFNSSILY